jgi:hypothetical protein
MVRPILGGVVTAAYALRTHPRSKDKAALYLYRVLESSIVLVFICIHAAWIRFKKYCRNIGGKN